MLSMPNDYVCLSREEALRNGKREKNQNGKNPDIEGQSCQKEKTIWMHISQLMIKVCPQDLCKAQIIEKTKDIL